MQATKNDLSFDKAELDYEALIRTARIAQGHCIERISQHIGKLRSLDTSVNSALEAEWLKLEAEKLLIASETWYTLQEGRSRSEITIVNKPAVE